jgi:imidazole glycerol-phosphate synthase subunit HisF
MRERLIPVVLMSNRRIVKTKGFKNPVYIGDPRNIIRIFSDFQVDELILHDIGVSRGDREIDFELLEEIAQEARMPIAYGGGVNPENAGRILSLGFEKIVLNSHAYANPFSISECAKKFGSQAVAVAIDVREKKGIYSCWSFGGKHREQVDPIVWAKESVSLGAGEIILTSIDREGSWQGVDLKLSKLMASQLPVPLVIQGGIGNIGDVWKAIASGDASAVAAGSFFVFQKENQGILISYPDSIELNG